MSTTLLRQWHTLRQIPRYPKKIDARTLVERLKAEGYPTTQRTIQRDLQALSAVFPLVCDDSSKPFGWSWMRDARGLSLPSMSTSTAMTFRLAEAFLSHVLPPATLRTLQPHFERAAEVLQATPGGQGRYPEQLQVIPHGQPQLPADVSEATLEALYEALFSARRLEVTYHKLDAQEPQEFEVHPLGLVARDHVLYLVGTLWGYDNPVQLAVHRILRVVVSDQPRRELDGFDLKRFVHSGETGFLVEPEPIELELRVAPMIQRLLSESPLGEDQRTERLADGRARLTVTVPYTKKLRAWVLGYGRLVEVVRPESLRAAVRDEARAVLAVYDDAVG